MWREFQVSSASRPLDSATMQDLPQQRASIASIVSGPFRYHATELRMAPERRTSILQRISSSVAWPDPPNHRGKRWFRRAACNMWSMSMSGETSLLVTFNASNDSWWIKSKYDFKYVLPKHCKQHWHMKTYRSLIVMHIKTRHAYPTHVNTSICPHVSSY